MDLDADDIREIADLLKPLMRTQADRRAVLNLHLSGEAVLDQIDFSGPRGTFVLNLITDLNEYGLSKDGVTPVLWKLLDGVKNALGQDKKESIERLKQLHRVPKTIPTHRQPVPPSVEVRSSHNEQPPDAARGMLVLNVEFKSLTREQLAAIMQRITEITEIIVFPPLGTPIRPPLR